MQLRVMTWNVQNLFLPGQPGGPPTASAFAAKIAALAQVVDEARPHVLALQEVGSQAALRRLQSALTHPMPHLMVGLQDPRGIAVALLSQRVLRYRVDVQDFPCGLLPVQVGDDPRGAAGPPTMDQLGRGALQATIRAGNRDVCVVTCHLKSKLLSYPDGRFFPYTEDERARFAAYALYRRSAEVTTVRVHLTDQLDGRGQDRALVLAGDLNDEVHAATTQILSGPPGSEIGTVGFDRPDAGDRARMWNLAPLIPEDQRFTRRFRGRTELIDHVLVSHHLVTSVASVQTLTASAQLPSITEDPAALRSVVGSDHAAVLATFDLSCT